LKYPNIFDLEQAYGLEQFPNCRPNSYIATMSTNSVPNLEELLEAAVEKFGSRCLWNIRPLATPQSMAVVARQLKTHGNLEAWRLGVEIEREISRACSPSKAFEGFFEAVVMQAGVGATKIQWVQYSGYNFFEPVPDAEFGWRLHFADLAVNKILAAASRREPRDLMDLYLIHRFVLPLWHGIWAAVGKDAAMTPEKIIERIRYHSHYAPEEVRNSMIMPAGIEIGAMIGDVRSALDDAATIIGSIPSDTVGTLLLDENDVPLTSPDQIPSTGRSLVAKATGAWPSGPDIDRLIIQRMIDVYGRNGRNIWTDHEDRDPPHP
jgi:hypothetical protein